MNFTNNEFGNYNSKRNNNYLNNYSNNFLQSSFEQRNQSVNNISNYDLRKIIKEELESQITPFKKQIFYLKDEINNIYNNLNRESIESLIKDIKLSLYNFVDKKYFSQKIEEMNSRIDTNANNINKPQNAVINNIISEIKKIKLEINNIKINNNNSINNSNRYSSPLNQIEKVQKGNMDNLSEMKLKDINDKTSFLKTDIENLKEEINSFKNSCSSSILGSKKNFSELELKFENLKTDSSSNKLNLLKDVNKIKADIKKIKDDLNGMKIKNEKNYMNDINKNNDVKIYEILEQLNLTKLSNFDVDKYNIICESYEKLMKNYINISKIVEHQNNNIIQLNNKFNEISFLSKKQAKKESINYSDDNNIMQKKLEILDRQIQYLQNRVEKISMDNMQVKESNLDYEKRREENLLMKQEVNKISNQMAVFNAFIEENDKRREELNIRIDEIKKELKEEKGINSDNNIKLLQIQNNIKTNEQKFIDLETKNKNLENIIIKIDEEKIKKLEEEIIRMKEKITASIEEGKRFDDIKNEIYENNRKNEKEKLNEIENKINKISDEINNIKIENKGSNVDESKIKDIEEKIKMLSNDKINENEFKNKKLISEEIENKVNNNSKNINKLEERISELEEKINNMKKEIKEKANNQIKSDNINVGKKIEDNVDKKIEDNEIDKKRIVNLGAEVIKDNNKNEISEFDNFDVDVVVDTNSQKKKEEPEIKDNETDKKIIGNLGAEVIKDDNKNEKDDFDDFDVEEIEDK